MPKVSVIIPVYNVEKYLRKCLDSVCNQTLKDIEIICVNDCSPDGSKDILEEYQSKDNRIIVFNKDYNEGLSAARNSGLDIANGDYIYFIDSDDYIDFEYLEKMYNVAKNKNVEIVLNTNIKSVASGCEDKDFYWPYYRNKLINGEFLQTDYSRYNSQCMTCVHFYKKSFIYKYDLKFPEGCIFEDNYFKQVSELYVDKIFAFYGPSYYYLQRTDSITGKKDFKFKEKLKIFERIYDYYINNGFIDKLDFKYIINAFSIICDDQELYVLTKEFMTKINKSLLINNIPIDNFSKFIVNSYIKTDSFDCYKSKFNKDLRLSYIRYSKDFI